MMMDQKKILNDEPLGYYLAPPMNLQLQKGKKKVKKYNLDRIFVIDGREGEAGKSTLAMQLAYSVDPTLNLNRIVFNARDFKKKIRELDKYKALVFDEAFNGLSSKGAISKENKELVRLLQECRARNLFIFIVLPSIFILEKYVAIFRSHALIHAFCSKTSANRRYYKIYNYTNKKTLYLYGKNNMSYKNPRISKTYRFYSKLPRTIDRAEYDKKKEKAFKSDPEAEKKEYSKHIKQRTVLSAFLKEKFNFNYVEQSKLLESEGFGIDSSVLAHFSRKLPINGKW